MYPMECHAWYKVRLLDGLVISLVVLLKFPCSSAARTTVQFQSFLDKFSPQDTTFEFKAPIDLTESALSSACLLHAVSGSITSSSSSLRRRRLMEIAEDAEEGPPISSPQVESTESPVDSNNKRLSQISDATAVPPSKNEADSPVVSNVTESEADAKTETASISSVSRKRLLDQFNRDPFERRSSTQSARPTFQELHHANPHAAPYRQKVKLEHRPSVDINSRPRTAGSMSRGQEYRPVAALPAGVRSRKPTGNPSRPKSTPDVPPVPTLASLRNAPPVPLLIPPPTLSIAKPKLSPGAKSMNALPSSGMSPEKQRLMKALELRKKQMEKKTQDLQKKPEQKKTPVLNSHNSTVAESLEDKENIGHSPVKKTPHEVTHAEAETKTAIVVTAEFDDKKPLSADIAKADSAVEMVSIASKDIEPTALQPEELPHDIIHEEKHANSAARDTDNDDHGEKKDLQSELAANIPLPDIAENEVMDTTDVEESTPPTKENIVTQQTMDLENAVTKIPDSPPAEETEPKAGREPEKEGKEDEQEDEAAAVELQVHQQEGSEESKTLQANNENGQPEPVAPAAPTDEQKQPVIEEPAIVVAGIRAEDVPLPPDSGEEFAEVPTTARRQTALEPVSTARMQQQQQPLPQPGEEAEKERSEKQKRVALLEPIQVHAPDFSDDENLLSDDSLMEELKSATVEEAQPVSVGKGPLSADGEPRTPLEAWQKRAVSNPGRPPSDFSSLPTDTRSISATYVDNSNQSLKPMPVLVAKKVNVSSGISKRIKALETFSNNRDSSPSAAGASDSTASNTVASPTASAFEKFRKRASVSLNGNLPSATPSARSSFISTSDSVPLNRSDSRSLSKTNSVSVTARIVRDSNTASEPNTNHTESSVLGLQRSPLIVKHDSSETQNPEQVSSDNVAELRHSTFSPRSSRRNSTDTTASPISNSRTSSQSRFDDRGKGDVGSSPDDRRDSRTSRLMRRMSSLRSSPHRNLTSSPGVEKQQSPSPHAERANQRPPPSKAIDIGEVNVQFPDTLLWKRRFLRVDDQGYLVLTPGNTDTGMRNIVKRYHLSEFKTPCLPDEERQELPNSILLDFRDGSTLQCACESRKRQASALQSKLNVTFKM